MAVEKLKTAHVASAVSLPIGSPQLLHFGPVQLKITLLRILCSPQPPGSVPPKVCHGGTIGLLQCEPSLHAPVVRHHHRLRSDRRPIPTADGFSACRSKHMAAALKKKKKSPKMASWQMETKANTCVALAPESSHLI